MKRFLNKFVSGLVVALVSATALVVLYAITYAGLMIVFLPPEEENDWLNNLSMSFDHDALLEQSIAIWCLLVLFLTIYFYRERRFL